MVMQIPAKDVFQCWCQEGHPSRIWCMCSRKSTLQMKTYDRSYHDQIPHLEQVLFPFNALTLLVGRQEGDSDCKNVGCWFVVGDDFTGVLHVFQLSPPLLSSLTPIKSRMEEWRLSDTGLPGLS